MRTIVHVSDIHFGKFDTTCLKPMLAAFQKLSPDLTIISGDLTQRARIAEYNDAKQFLSKLEKPYFVIPGNHDIRPFFAFHKRFVRPFDRYDMYISDEHEPVYADAEIAIAGIDTVRPLKIKDGKVNLRQIDRVCDWFQDVKKHHPEALQMVVTHHPLNLPVGAKRRKLAGRAKMAVRRLADSGIDMYLSGHYHESGVSHSAERHKLNGYSALFIQAGTVSTRQRNEVQSFNVIKTEGSKITVETHLWNPYKKIFQMKSSKLFFGKSGGWREEKK